MIQEIKLTSSPEMFCFIVLAGTICLGKMKCEIANLPIETRDLCWPLIVRLVFSLLLVGAASISSAEESSDYGTLGVDLRSFYYVRDKQELPTSEALTQALMLRYDSAYMNDIVGLNASFFGNLKLAAEDGKGGTDLLQDEEDGSQESYGKLAEVFLKFKLPVQSTLDLGRMELFTPLLNDPDYRATPTSSQAGLFKIGNNQFSAYIAATDKGSGYTETTFNNYTDTSGEAFNIYATGLTYESANSLYLHGAFGQADNVMDQAYFNARYPWKINDKLNLLFDAYHYSGWANGEGALAGVGSDYRSSVSSLALRLSWERSILTLNLQGVNGDSYRLSWDGDVHDNTSYYSWQSVQRMNFDWAGENSWQLRFDYDFEHYAPGLHFMGRYISGDDIDRQDGLTGSEWERDIDFIYQPPGIKNLILKWRYAVVRTTETYDSDEHRLIVQYSLDAF